MEGIVGRLIKGQRDRVFLATKLQLRIPGEGDQRSGVIAITIPG